MSFELTKLLSLLVYPLSQTLTLHVLSVFLLLFGARRTGCCLAILTTLWLYLCSIGATADWLMGSLEDSYPPKALPVVPMADAIVVLGGATRGDTHMSALGDLNQQADRLVHAARLFNAGKAPLIVLSGGATQPGARPEAQLMRDHLVNMGVPEKAILTEEGSRNTYENAQFSKVVLDKRDAEQILLVTSAFHMRRAERLFNGRQLTVIPAPTDYQRLIVDPVVPRWLPTVDDLARSTYAIREHVGYWVYVIQGRI